MILFLLFISFITPVFEPRKPSRECLCLKICIVFFLETTNAIREPTREEIHDHNVIITTLVAARMLWRFYKSGRLHFTHILIDEAAQPLEPECVTPLVMADKKTKIVLAGDHRQVIYLINKFCPSPYCTAIAELSDIKDISTANIFLFFVLTILFSTF